MYGCLYISYVIVQSIQPLTRIIFSGTDERKGNVSGCDARWR